VLYWHWTCFSSRYSRALRLCCRARRMSLPSGQHWLPSNSAPVAGYPARPAGPQQVYMPRPPSAAPPGVNKFGIIQAPRPPLMDPNGMMFPHPPPTKPPDPPGLWNLLVTWTFLTILHVFCYILYCKYI